MSDEDGLVFWDEQARKLRIESCNPVVQFYEEKNAMKIGEYFIYKTERGTFIVAHESGEAGEFTEEQMVAALRKLWEEGF